MKDIIIKNGTIVDGSGKGRFYGDVSITQGKLTQVGGDAGSEAAQIIDAEGLIVAPGFIDGHTHSDVSLALGSDSYNFLEQGVTTQIAGQCGTSPVPYIAENVRGKDEEKNEEIKRIMQTPLSFMQHMENTANGTNCAFLIGHGAIRAFAMGFGDEKPNHEQMQRMQRIVEDAMAAGYIGYSSGLVYAPSVYADTQELIELASVMESRGGVYASHIRGEGDTVERAVAEAIHIGEMANVPVIISHLKVIGKNNEGASENILEMIRQANERGTRVYADQYPFSAGSAPLMGQIPPKFLVGGREASLNRLKDRETRREILHAIFNLPQEFESSIYGAGFQGTLIAEAANVQSYVGKTIDKIAEERSLEPIDALCEILLENDGICQGIYFSQNVSDMMRIMAHPYVTSGSDWSDYPDTRHSPDKIAGGHPRGTATAPKRLQIIRDNGLRTLEDAVRSMTYAQAVAAGLSGQGLLLEGRDANVTIFDYAKIGASADYINPFKENTGIETVIVNGVVALKQGKALGVRAGKLIKRGC